VSGGRISVVVPVRGDGIFLRAALMSVAQQAIPVAELLVVASRNKRGSWSLQGSL